MDDDRLLGVVFGRLEGLRARLAEREAEIARVEADVQRQMDENARLRTTLAGLQSRGGG